MKPIVKKILEAGLVDRGAAQLMEKWGQVDRGAADIVGRKDLRTATENTLTKFAEEVEELIERDREDVRETRLAIQVGEPILAWWPGRAEKMVLFRDNLGNFLFPLKEKINIHPGAVFVTTDDRKWNILSGDELVIGDHPYTIQVAAEDSRAG